MRKFLFAFLLFSGNICLAQQLKYTVGNNDWDADSLGNQRVVLSADAKGSNVVKAIINWRRSDSHPENKQLFVVDAASGKRILNAKVESINRESGTIYFEPTSSTKYFIYYLPY